MIPLVRTRIDLANAAIKNDNRDDLSYRISIPASEIAELSEYRRSERTKRARAERNARILEWEDAKARADLIRVDEQRPYGLPRGKECPSHIWEKIFDYVNDVEDIMNLRGTCVLFMDLLEMKYKTLRLIEVMLKFGGGFGGVTTFIALRQVCKSTKAAMDQWMKEDNRFSMEWSFEGATVLPPFDPNTISEPSLPLYSDFLKSAVKSLRTRSIPCHLIQFRIICLSEWVECRDANRIAKLRSRFHRFLKICGTSVKSFHYYAHEDLRGNYDRLSSWMPLMPNATLMQIRVYGESVDYVDPPLLPEPIPEFPSCPNLKHFANEGIGLRPPFVEQIFLANPWIRGALLHVGRFEFPEDEFSALQRSLATLQLERLCWFGGVFIPRHHQLPELRFTWPLKYITLSTNPREVNQEVLPSRTVFDFVNSFRPTLEELTVTCKIRDTGGFLDVLKVKRLLWKLWPEFRSMEFITPLENLEHLDIDVISLEGVHESLETAKGFIYDFKLPAIIPSLRKIRIRREFVHTYMWKWNEIWTA